LSSNPFTQKGEYETAILQSQKGQPVTVKVKHFSLQGANLLRQLQSVRYSNEPSPRMFMVVLPATGNPIKISALSIASLDPVQNGIRRALRAQVFVEIAQ